MTNFSESESEGEVAQSCPTLCNSMDCSLSGSTVHEILQARIQQWVAIPFSRGFRDWTWISCIAGRLFTIWVTRNLWGESRSSNLLTECGGFSLAGYCWLRRNLPYAGAVHSKPLPLRNAWYLSLLVLGFYSTGNDKVWELPLWGFRTSIILFF